MRRVNCPRCGVVVEQAPWSDGKSPTTFAYRWLLAVWAKRMSRKEYASIFRTSWNAVFCAMNYAVQWGLARRILDGNEAIGVDEVLWHRGHKYLSVVYQIDNNVRRLIWVGKDRAIGYVSHFFDELSGTTETLRFVCSDMWKPHISVIAGRAAQVVHVLDRFHVAAMLNKAIDHVRADETKRLRKGGHDPILKHSRWSLLKRRENLTEKKELKLKDLLRYKLKNHARRLAQRRFASPMV